MLLDMELDNDWKVENLSEKHPKGTGGVFSVGYNVKNKDGRVGFLKALDFSSAVNAKNSALVIEAMISAYNFERRLLERCKTEHLSRVVVPIDSGEVNVEGFIGIGSKVYYIIFEKADGDIRSFDEKWTNFDLAFILRSLHHTAVGLNQLHSRSIAHQDIKPSNILIFNSRSSKVSDLGCAASLGESSPRDEFDIPGDMTYAPPELIYKFRVFHNINDRYIADLYLFGSLIFNYFTSVPAIRATILKGKIIRGDDFINDLPFLQAGFHVALNDLAQEVKKYAGNMTSSIVEIAKELCEPDPRVRNKNARFGDPRQVYGLTKYISKLDYLAKRAEYKI